MNIHVYSDESGVLDRIHYNYYVFGGLIILGDDEKQKCSRMFSAAENALRKSGRYQQGLELKAFNLSPADRMKLFRSLNNFHKFGVIIDQKRINRNIFNSKKDKQRYLDYAYKIGVKRAFEALIKQEFLRETFNGNINFGTDEHSTATNGRYELRESLEREFKYGTFNYSYVKFFPPIFPNVRCINLDYCNSKGKVLVRASDIIANRLYYLVNHDKEKLSHMHNMSITFLP